MRRQRFIHTFPSEDDLVIPDSDTASIISSPYSYPETVWSQMTSPVPEGSVPFCIYQYPFFQVAPTETELTGQFTSPMTTGSMNNLENFSHYTNEFSEICDCARGERTCDTSHEGGLFPEDFPYDSFGYADIEDITPTAPRTYPVVSSYGTATILLRHLIRVDVSPEKAVHVINPPATCVASINKMGDRSCIIHPNGRVFHDGDEIHMQTLNRKAKISNRGILFTSTDHCLSYLVDASGTKTTSAKFRDLNHDLSLKIFCKDSTVRDNVEGCYAMVNDTIYKRYSNGDEVWFLGGFRIKQNQSGDVKVSRCNGRQIIRTSPTTGQVLVKTFSVECIIGRYPDNYFLVRKGKRQVTSSLKGFNVQNGSQKAGINNSGNVVLF